MMFAPCACGAVSDGGTGVRDEKYRWPKVGDMVIVPYENHIYRESKLLMRAMRTIETKTNCIKFVKRTNEKDYLNFPSRSRHCSSSVGMQGGKQTVSLASNCISEDAAIHELIHALGFDHMHSHSNRDEYVTIIHKNIESEERNNDYENFEKLDADDYTSFGTPYDFDSIMHYSPMAFSRNRLVVIKGKSGIVKKNYKMSAGDVTRLQRMYKCDEGTTTTSTTELPTTTSTYSEPDITDNEVPDTNIDDETISITTNANNLDPCNTGRLFDKNFGKLFCYAFRRNLLSLYKGDSKTLNCVLKLFKNSCSPSVKH
jgi:hypothetical protein